MLISPHSETKNEVDRVPLLRYRTDPARSRETGGVGLALAIVQRTATACGSRCTCPAPGRRAERLRGFLEAQGLRWTRLPK